MHPQIQFIVIHQSIVMSFAVAGNLFLLFVIIRGNAVARRRLSSVQLLLLHTCAADLSFALLSLGTEIVTMITFPYFLGPDWSCKTMRYLQMIPLYASPFLLVAIAADRYQAICRPLSNMRASRYRRPNFFAAVAWMLALVLSIPQFFVWHKKDGRTTECATTYGRDSQTLKRAYVFSFNILAWLLPSILATLFYYKVCKAVWMSAANKKRFEPVASKTSCATEVYVNHLHQNSNGFRRQTTEFDRKRIQTVRLTLTIIVCNFFLWLPFCVVNVLQAIWPNALSPNVTLYLMILGNLNSCVNPWIYILFNRSHVALAFSKRHVMGVVSQRSETECLTSSTTVPKTKGRSLSMRPALNFSINKKPTANAKAQARYRMSCDNSQLVSSWLDVCSDKANGNII